VTLYKSCFENNEKIISNIVQSNIYRARGAGGLLINNNNGQTLVLFTTVCTVRTATQITRMTNARSPRDTRRDAWSARDSISDRGTADPRVIRRDSTRTLSVDGASPSDGRKAGGDWSAR